MSQLTNLILIKKSAVISSIGHVATRHALQHAVLRILECRSWGKTVWLRNWNCCVDCADRCAVWSEVNCTNKKWLAH